MSKVILIKGASSGKGYDATFCLLKNGHTIYAASRNVEGIECTIIFRRNIGLRIFIF
ncbi:MAG: hypothetical protein WCR29_01595 [Bacteroidales bacterium]